MNPIKIIALVSWTYFLNDFYLIYIQNSNLPLLWSLDVIFYTLIPTMTIIFLIKKGHITKEILGISTPFKMKYLRYGLYLCLGMLLIYSGFLRVIIYKYLSSGLFIGYGFPKEKVLFYITVIYAAVSAGILEEFIFRGIVISQLEKYKLSKFSIVIISCIIFGCIHWGQGLEKIVGTAVIGIVPAIWYLKTRQNWGNIIFHATYNYILFVN